MIAIKEFEMPECCGDCTLNSCFNWKHYCNVTLQEVDFEVETRPSDCPLVEIGTCKECKYYTVYEIEYFQTNQKEQFSYCEKYDRLGNNHLSPDFYCGDYEKAR